MASGVDALDDAVRRALYRRMIAQLRSAIRGASEEQVLRAIAARSASGSIAEILAAVPAEAGETTDAWAEELLRGAVKKEEMLEEAGGTYTTGQVAQLLGISVAAVQQRRQRNRLLAVPLNSGEWGYPVVQFSEAGVPPTLARVLAAFEEPNPWVQLSVLLADDYGEGRIIDWIHAGDRIEDALRIAASFGHQAAA
ncbi:MAG: hypothetical protein H0W11_01340 [Gemmatimonadetes bacterium]|jgi:hypothetical protein|nr:hypothetical protein [Gemmatimonadota bacterium]